MRYIKRFNEDADNHQQVFKDELRDFCETNLAYLLDDAELRIVQSPYSELHFIIILLNEPKRWVEIKDHMIPFLTRLDNKYEISNQFTQSKINSRLSEVEDIRLYLSFGVDNVYRDNGTGGTTTKNYMSCKVKDLIADNIKSPNARISDIRFYVKGYKKEKKSILTKIKSYFK